MILILPFILQAILILIDEGYFHIRRGLPKWEKIGHPLDTLSTLVCFLYVLGSPYHQTNLFIYIALAIFSCIMITKDEFIHKEHCPGAENWLHAFLFILHPIVLILLGVMWASPTWLGFQGFIQLQTAFIFLFFLYQTIFWNFIWKNTPVVRL